MGLDAEIIAIGKRRDLEHLACLEYPSEYYDSHNVSGDTKIIVTVFHAWTTDQSYVLAAICNTLPWALGEHNIKTLVEPIDMADEQIGDEYAINVHCTLRELLRMGVELWYKPNG